MSTTARLGKGSGFFFFSGFFFGKLHSLSLPVVSVAFKVLSLASYMMGYGLWFIASHFYPNHVPKKDKWYGFAQFKEQHLCSATLGILATTLSIVGFFFLPLLLLPASWIFLASNFLWASAEYHKLNNPPCDPDYSHTYQKVYTSYAIKMALISCITALSITLSFLFPPVTVPIFTISTVITIALGICAAENWLTYNFGTHKPTLAKASYNQMHSSLGTGITAALTNPAPPPYHHKNLLKSPENNCYPLEPLKPIYVQTCPIP